MRIELTERQKSSQAAFRAFVNEEIVPNADRYDREERVEPEAIKKLAAQGMLGAVLPVEFGGAGMDAITFGLLNEEVGRGCSSLRSLLTVHSMVASAILKWGSKAQKERWLRKLAAGEAIAAFALTEPDAGSDAKSIQASATSSDSFYTLNGRKKWITFGQIADLFLVFAQNKGRAAAFLVESDRPGISIKPITGILGVRGSMLAEVTLEDCRIPGEGLLAREGFGLSHVAASALDYGRYSVACGCVGLAQACLDASVEYTSKREQFGTYLKDHQLIRQMITEMVTGIKAARLLCYQAGYLRDKGDPNSIMEISIAKYFSSRVAAKAASDAVQIHGANGCSSDYPVQRYMRDAKIMEIIEGSTQIQEITIANYPYQSRTS